MYILIYNMYLYRERDFPGGSDNKSICLQCRIPRFDPWFWEDPLEKEMATRSGLLPWKIPWTEEPGRLQSTGAAESQTWLRDFTFFLSIHTHTHTYPCMYIFGFPGGATVKEPTSQYRKHKRHRFDPWRRKWQPIPVFLPGESHGQRSLGGYSPWSFKQSNTTDAT